MRPEKRAAIGGLFDIENHKTQASHGAGDHCLDTGKWLWTEIRFMINVDERSLHFLATSKAYLGSNWVYLPQPVILMKAVSPA